MKKIIYILIVAVFAGLMGFSDNASSTTQKGSSAVKTGEVKEMAARPAAAPEKGEKVIKAAVKKYSMKSGIITFERTGVSANKKIMVYFDDYGTKERNEVYNDKGELEAFRFSDGGTMYKVSLKNSAEKIAYIMGPGSLGTEMKFVAEPFKSENEKQQQNFKKLPDMKILGKPCQAYSVKNDASETIFAGRDDLLLYVKVIMKMGETVTRAVEFKEDAEINPALFNVPADYTVKKYH